MRNHLRIKVKTALASKNLRLYDLAATMSVDPGNLSLIFKRNIQIETALLINDSLYLLTGECLTLEDFRQDKND